MATAVNKTRCSICGKEKATFRCAGCLEEFCNKHLVEHRQQLHKQLDEIELNRDLFRQSLTEHIQKPNINNTLVQQINKWERDAIKKIQQTAEEARQIVLKKTSISIHQFEIKLNKLTDQLRESRDEDDFNEINLHQFQEELKQLTNELSKPSNISIREDSTPFISKLVVEVSDKYATPVLFSELELFTRKNLSELTISWRFSTVIVNLNSFKKKPKENFLSIEDKELFVPNIDIKQVDLRSEINERMLKKF